MKLKLARLAFPAPYCHIACSPGPYVTCVVQLMVGASFTGRTVIPPVLLTHLTSTPVPGPRAAKLTSSCTVPPVFITLKDPLIVPSHPLGRILISPPATANAPETST